MKKFLTLGLALVSTYVMSQETDMVPLFENSIELPIKVSESKYKARQDSLADMLTRQLRQKSPRNSSYRPFKNLEEDYEEHIVPLITPIMYPFFSKHPYMELELRDFSADFGKIESIRYRFRFKWGASYIANQKKRMQEKIRYLDSINELYIQYEKEEKRQLVPQ